MKFRVPLATSQTIQCLIAALLAGFLSGLATGQNSAIRITDKQGRELEVTVLAVEQGKVRVSRKSDGRTFSIPIDSLSEASQEKVHEVLAAGTKGVGKPAVSEVDLPGQALAEFRRRWSEIEGRLAMNVPIDKLNRATSLLGEVLNLEKDLVIAGSPKDPSSPIQWPKEIDERTPEKVKALRQSIRDKERGNLLLQMDKD